MKATSIKQIKFNRGQVSDLLSERLDMGLQNACGTVYNNIYINRYGQIQSSPSLLLCADSFIPNGGSVLCMFDTGTDKVFMITLEVGGVINVYGPLSKSNPYQKISYTNVFATHTLTSEFNLATKAYQFGYNVVFFGDNCKPWLLNLVPNNTEWTSGTLTVKENFFNNVFDHVYIRGMNTDAPTGFTVPTSGNYKILNQTQVTSGKLVSVQRNGAGSAFTQDLVGQVILSKANGGALQVRKVVDGDNLTATVLSPLIALTSSATDILIPWHSSIQDGKIVYAENSAEWIFGYEHPFGENVLGATRSYPDSVMYVNQRLLFGGNDYCGNIICASRIGVIDDFDPETATDSDAFTVQIASKDFCRIVDFVVSNDELRIACTNGEYAIPLAYLSPSGVLNGFSLRSEVGTAANTSICDCGGLTAYVSNDRNAIYGTQFNLLKDRFQPISLSSQTSNIINNCVGLVYLTNRPNSEGNCLVGLNADGTMFVAGIDLNAGLIGLSKMTNYPNQVLSQSPALRINVSRMFAVGAALWVEYYMVAGSGSNFVARFAFNEIFEFPSWYNAVANGVVIPSFIYELVFAYPQEARTYRALYYDSTNRNYVFVAPTGANNNNDGTYTLTFDDSITQSNIVCVGFIKQSDWRSVEIGIGMATREINKQIIKLEGVIEPTQITGAGEFRGLTLTPEQSKNFITLTRSKDVETMDVDNLANTSYTENSDMVWRRAFDNPDRELHWGVSMVAPFLIKSLTAVVQYDEVS